MSYAPPDPTTLPPLASTLLQALAQHGGTALAGVMVTYGLVQKSQTTEILDLVSSVVLAAGALAWTYVMHSLHRAKAVAAVKSAAISGQP